jgi:endoglucanase
MDYVVAGLQFQTLKSIAQEIKDMGFNTVRLPWSLSLVRSNPIVDNQTLAANPNLIGLRALDILDQVIAALAKESLLILLDNHMSDADWCCSDNDGNGLWYNANFSKHDWISIWELMVKRYSHVPAVIGADLRNEIRPHCANNSQCIYANWGGSDPDNDWHAAATDAGNAILRVNPKLLIVVEGLSYANDLRGVAKKQINLHVPHRLVYQAHLYSWDFQPLFSCEELWASVDIMFGYINDKMNLPLIIGEFGTCNYNLSCVNSNVTASGGYWFNCFTKYIAAKGLGWIYWSLNGTESTGTGRTWGKVDFFGILNGTWNGAASNDLLNALIAIQNSTNLVSGHR